VRVADTSALYAWADESDVHHARAWRAIEDPEPVVVPTEILVETHNLIAYRAGRAAAKNLLEDLLRLPNVSVAEQASFDAVWRVFTAPGSRLSLADAVVVQTCRATGGSPLAFDRAILRAVK
jgi:predicted nucleic acid-binding protein